jgi:hypothetical protein
MITMTPEGNGNDTPLSMDEAIKAYAAVSPEEVQKDHPEEEEEAPEEDAELSDEEEEVDGEPAEEDDAEEGDDSDEIKAEGKFVSKDGKVRLPDGSVASIDDLIKGNLREADYTRKNQERAERERQLEAKQAQITQFEQQLAQTRDLTIKVLQARIPQEPDAEMLMSDPIGYMQAKASYDKGMMELNKLNAETQQIREHQQALAAQQHQETLAREQQLLAQKVPELSDPKKKDATIKAILSTATEYGISQEEFATITDHRVVVALRDLARLKSITKATQTVPQKIAGKPPVQTGSKRVAPDQARAREADTALQRLNKTGSLRDGVAAYLATQKR